MARAVETEEVATEAGREAAAREEVMMAAGLVAAGTVAVAMAEMRAAVKRAAAARAVAETAAIVEVAMKAMVRVVVGSKAAAEALVARLEESWEGKAEAGGRARFGPHVECIPFESTSGKKSWMILNTYNK